VWIDGRICRGAEAHLSVFDRGARDGEGLFETLRVYRGRAFLWERHLERLVLSAAELGFPVPPSPAVLSRARDELLQVERLKDAVLRITVTRGVPGRRPTRAGCWIEAEPVSARLWRGVARGAVAIVSRNHFEPGRLGRYKTTSRLAYHLAREEARAAGAEEAILVNREGQVLEGVVSNVFVVFEGEIVTPPLDAGILPGITRGWVLRACHEAGLDAAERPVARDEMDRAREVFLTNSVQEIVPLAVLAGRAIPDQRTGEFLRERYRDAVENDPARG
jgi:branched-subunit amino acid aminotransferase/4-amino-4-deoxychorismate lyase